MAVSCKIHWELQSKAHQERLLLCRYLSSHKTQDNEEMYIPSPSLALIQSEHTKKLVSTNAYAKKGHMLPTACGPQGKGTLR